MALSNLFLSTTNNLKFDWGIQTFSSHYTSISYLSAAANTEARITPGTPLYSRITSNR